jgi:hypothetical protein
MIRNLLFSFVILTTACTSPVSEQPVYLFSYFNGNGDGLHLAYSEDGKTWNALGSDSIYLKPELGKDKLMRDPCIVQDDAGTFHMVWTTGWWDQGIGYASSKDLKNWSAQLNIPVMEKFEGTKNAWAPELFYDKKDKTFYIFWASTVPGAFPEVPTSESEKGLNHRMYFTSTKDFKSFTETKVYFDPGFSVIDCAILEKDGQYHMFLKNENSNPPEKNIRLTSAAQPFDFPTAVSESITGDYWAEGPAPLQVGDSVYVYFDKYRDKKYGAVRSKDLVNWDDVSEEVTFPKGIRHGTAFAVPRKILEGLK